MPVLVSSKPDTENTTDSLQLYTAKFFYRNIKSKFQNSAKTFWSSFSHTIGVLYTQLFLPSSNVPDSISRQDKDIVRELMKLKSRYKILAGI